MADWYKCSSSQCNREPLAPCSGSADHSNINGQPGRGQQINRRRDACGLIEGLSGLQPGRGQQIIKRWDACGSTEGLSPQQPGRGQQINRRRDACGLTEGLSG